MKDIIGCGRRAGSLRNGGPVPPRLSSTANTTPRSMPMTGLESSRFSKRRPAPRTGFALVRQDLVADTVSFLDGQTRPRLHSERREGCANEIVSRRSSRAGMENHYDHGGFTTTY